MSVFANTLFGKAAAGAALLAALAVSGCGGDAGGDAGSVTPDAPSFEDAMVDYAACMREHGVDMPDPTFSGDGSTGGGAMTFAIPLGASDSGGPGGAAPGAPVLGSVDETFKAASEACQPIMEAAQQNMPKPSPEEEAKMRDEALKFAQCMREHGVDMPDPTFEGGGGAAIAIQGSSGDGPGSFDADKFNEASSACSAAGLGGGFQISTSKDGEGATGGLRIGSGASK